MIRVFRRIESEPGRPWEQDVAPYMFGPVITGLLAAVRTGMWRVVGHIPIRDWVYVPFVSATWDTRTGLANRWYLWNGEEYQELGSRLPDHLKSLEFLVVWDPHDIVERIETGEYPYPYGELIKENRFTPTADHRSQGRD